MKVRTTANDAETKTRSNSRAEKHTRNTQTRKSEIPNRCGTDFGAILSAKINVKSPRGFTKFETLYSRYNVSNLGAHFWDPRLPPGTIFGTLGYLLEPLWTHLEAVWTLFESYLAKQGLRGPLDPP